jgi:aquaporin Z
MYKYVVEFFGTMILLFTIIATGNPLAIGAALSIIVYFGGPISGGNYNPAVTILMVIAGKMPKEELIPYILVQVAAAIVVSVIYQRVYDYSS